MLTGKEWTRRQVLGRAGIAVAGVAGLSVIGCTATRSRDAPQAPQVQRFMSRPDLSPPAVTVTPPAGLPGADGSRYILVTPAQGGPGQGGAMICDTNGRLIWFSPASPARRVMNLSVQEYRGQPVLTWWQGSISGGHGQGTGMIADSSYRTIATVRAGNGLMADLHEFVLTPHGTVLLTAYRERPADLTGLGGPAKGTVLSGVAQEIDVATGQLLFEWDSLDHVAVSETYLKFSPDAGEDLIRGATGLPFDYFHINSIAVAPDGDLLISARNTCTVYKVARRDGTVRWRLGGRYSSFVMAPGTRFYWQHDVRLHGASVLSVFDNGAAPARESRSRALLIRLNTTAMLATLRRQYVHPSSTLLATAMGSAQRLPGGGMFVGWGTEPGFSLFSTDGRMLLDGRLPAKDSSYRAFLHDWSGHPAGSPAIAVRSGPSGGASVYASWNGATGVRHWTALAGTTASSLAEAARAPWASFETAVHAPHAGPYFAVEARDASGRVLGRSGTVRLAPG
jgi:hypothetical protein